MNISVLIRIFARHKVAANLLMIIILMSGAIALSKLNTQMNPDVASEQVLVEIEWPGASAEDVDRTIVEAVEPAVRNLDGVASVGARAREGIAELFIEFRMNSDMSKALGDVDTAIRNLTTLPDDAEKPVIVQEEFLEQIMHIVISGPMSELALKSFAKRIRNDLLRRGIDRVLTTGIRDEEIWVEMPARSLQQLDLSLSDISSVISNASRDLPSGSLTGGVEKQVRAIGQQTEAEGVAGLTISTDASGRRLTLQDVAAVRANFQEGQVTGRRGGNPAIQITLGRARTGDVLALTDIANRYLAEIRPTLPENLKLEIYNTASEDLRSRISLLVANAVAGFILVIAALGLFLRPRMTLWVAAGIPVSLAAAFAIMLLLGHTINMLSLFALIMVLGIVADDAIVVGEHVETLRESGLPPDKAAEQGARRMFVPVLAASFTTVCAFAPMLLLSGEAGAYVEPIPVVVIAVLVASTIECFLILPRHLRRAMEAEEQPSRFALLRRVEGALEVVRTAFLKRFDRFRDTTFVRWIGYTTEYRYATVATALALLCVGMGLQASGRVGFNFMPAPEGQWMQLNVLFTPGTSRDTVEQQLDLAEQALERVENKLGYEDGKLVRMAFGQVGATIGSQVVDQVGDFVGAMQVEVLPADQRSQRLPDIMALWRSEIDLLPGIDLVVVSEQEVGLGNPGLSFRLTHDDPNVLKKASAELQTALAGFDGVSAIRDNLPLGRPELLVRVTPRGEALGFTTDSVSRQLRSALDGSIAKKFPRGDEEVKIRVRLRKEDQSEEALRSLYLRAPSGAEVPLSEVVELEDHHGLGRIFRDAGDRVVAIFAQVDPRVSSVGAVRSAIEKEHLSQIMEKYGVKKSAQDQSGDEQEFFMDFMLNVLLGFSLIYFTMVWVLGSYTRPATIMFMIPFGVVGAIFGHWIMGYSMNLLSYVAVMGLAGILVNDAILLLDSIVDEEKRGQPTHAAIIEACRLRLRPIILTSLTTVAGLLPLMFETSLQAQFLVPMAITIVFGLTTSTLLVVVLVPATLMIGHDLRPFTRRMLVKLGRGSLAGLRWVTTPSPS
jgi:multidrug efflux pump subunit AcrB